MWERVDGSYALRFGDSLPDTCSWPITSCSACRSLPFATVGSGWRGVRRQASEGDPRAGHGNEREGPAAVPRPASFVPGVERELQHRWGRSRTAGTASSARTDAAGCSPSTRAGNTGAGYPVDEPHAGAPDGVVDQALTFLDAGSRGCARRSGRSWLDSWVDESWSKGSYAAFLPGQWTSLFGYMGRAEGDVHFAGEHASTYSQGYLNGGVETGLRAARENLHAAGRSARTMAASGRGKGERARAGRRHPGLVPVPRSAARTSPRGPLRPQGLDQLPDR